MYGFMLAESLPNIKFVVSIIFDVQVSLVALSNISYYLLASLCLALFSRLPLFFLAQLPFFILPKSLAEDHFSFTSCDKLQFVS